VRGLVLSLRRERLLLLADTHVGYEVELRRVKGVNVMSQTRRLVEKVLELVEMHNATSVVVLGDVKHELPVPRESAEEVRAFLSTVAKRVPMLLIPGNHDSILQEVASGIGGVEVAPTRGVLVDRFLLINTPTNL
jgi:metallophosphoesterase superfamily enzyme